ncbi:hypothetical protein GCM10022403_018820 [Streptomyces coacervatus]|uniref:Uncharacterized protein n=1 Tax=Streptomyces coacervatus TaxID=647381 RepID=A0ABP7H4V4_9ACTN|nr:type II toxin-antitoxin system prevent-host-death family antitoxin [Streptomyces coacervatus]MDF2267362.1 type II toxin-antitoxin system prevent-host-death family antitoxin [Streptomyces coacervatus]
MAYRERPQRAGRRSSQIPTAAARGETATVTKNSVPVAWMVPLSDTELPGFGLPDLTDDKIDAALQRMRTRA